MGRIVHFGLGNFARAHLLDYTADAGGWDVVGVSLRSAAIRDGLARQGNAYDLCIQGEGVKRIDVLSDVLVAPENPQAVLDAMAQADIISATVTEKGYHLGADGTLNFDDPLIAQELATGAPQSLIGYLAHHLATSVRPVTIMSCDNRVENGAALAAAVKRFAQTADLSIDVSRCAFPNAMVDRITPATTDAVRALSGDPMAVPTEAFREWVIEDHFAAPRPDWQGVQFVKDVRPHELRKLRMLNGAHSLLAYAGLARGHTYVHDAIGDPYLRSLTQQLMAEAAKTLPAEVTTQAPSYADALIKRFENPELKHRLDQIAMDGSQKLPYRFFETLRAAPSPAIAEGIRAWIAFCCDQSAQGKALNDPLAEQLGQAARAQDPSAELLALIGGTDLIAAIRA